MRQLYLSAALTLLISLSLHAQTGCPGCVVSVPPGLAEDTIYLPTIPDGEVGKVYNQDISFRMPKTTTPVNLIDSTTPPNLTISKIEILGMDGLPPGLYWQPNQTVFEVGTQTDGCIKICGTPSVADSFTLMVRVKATIFVLTKEATFPMRIYIAPKVSNTDGFSLENFTGCGATTVNLINNVPSNGAPGFTYAWNFGDNTTSTSENPPPHTYNTPGIYPVSYQAIVDTAGFKIESVRVLSVECVDQLGLGTPDLYMQIRDPNGVLIFDSSPYINNTQLPHTFPVGITLDVAGNYNLQVSDEDSGIKGSDDLCGVVSFNILSNDTIVAGGLTVVLNIVHPVDTIVSKDTVTVYALPIAPQILAPNGLTDCAGSDSLVLGSTYGAGNQWFLNGQPISGANAFLYQPVQSGFYQVQFTNSNGCTAVSDSVQVTVNPLPALPVYANINNSLRANPALLPAQYSLQWYNGTTPIAGATGLRYCATANGNYGLLVTDVATGCTRVYYSTVVYNPNFDCTVGTNELTSAAFTIFPNPATTTFQVQLNENLLADGTAQLWDVAGRLVKTIAFNAAINSLSVDCSDLNAGVFTLQIQAGAFRGIGKVVLVR